MEEIFLSYLAYNLAIGIFLTAFHAIKEKGAIKPVNLVWLLLFPAVGLGKWIYQRTIKKNEAPEYSERWYMWKYMVKVNWGYMGLIGIGPLILLMMMSFGLMIGDFFASVPGAVDDQQMLQIMEMGLILIMIMYVFVMVFVLIIPFLVLIILPRSQYKSIEKTHLLEIRRAQIARQQSVAQPAKAVRKPIPLFPEIESFLTECEADFDTIDKQRRTKLEEVAQYIVRKHATGDAVNLTFICTHNSRRSQFGQVWAAVAAAKFGIRNIQTYSGGTEETAFNKRAVEACRRVGLKITGTVGTNPRYSIRFSDSAGALDCFSKTFDNPSNPQQGFASIMTCSDADENCPIVNGAEFRASLTYDDPKIADRTVEETAKYDERCKQIATEMLYLFSKV